MDDFNEILLNVLKFIFAIGVTTFVLSILFPPPSNKKNVVKSCPPHKWDYDADGQMYCKNCPRKPGQ